MYIVIFGNGSDQSYRTFYAASDEQAEPLAHCFIPAGYALRYVSRVIAN